MVANSFGRMIVSADVDPEMVSYCKGNTPNPVLCSIEFLPFRSTAFDAIFNSHVLEHLMGVERVLSEFIRVLKDGGTLVVLIPTKHRDFYRERGHIRGYDEARLVSDLNVAGFKTVQVFYDKFYVLGMGKIKLGIERIAIRFLNALPILWMKCNLLAIATKT
jgi:ubiquinone/menaquinone biosynthesis C-methylase UbiE